MHRRILITGVALVVLMPLAKAYPWHDTIGWAQYGVSEVINYANWAAQEANTAATELNTLHSYEQEVIQLARMGNPAALSQLTGVNFLTIVNVTAATTLECRNGFFRREPGDNKDERESAEQSGSFGVTGAEG